MKKTINIDAKLLAEAREWSGAKTDTETVRLGLKSLLHQIASQRMIALIGSEPDALDYETPRRREPPAPRHAARAKRQAAR